ncbi:dihydroxyacetone kinase subunit L [Rhizobium sp. LC145]|uniref:dihydroxyacetone kinase subunit L n=1 Tax=Rhizobium sp. LC145 TaxID=1120688 RepID=UPI00062A3391|nr:dihydroxyacetone kinase subunit L [Rhizobium sp. LC145]KKX25682.1 Dak phosphatase [Rhizobium sp. LC145]TKT57976.1 dihydroxyacetone kinase subunit L [Rhizobiaceae bacterium LC148]
MDMNQTHLKGALDRIIADLPAIEQELNAADAKLGDGDTGGMFARVIGAMHAAEVPSNSDLGATLSAYARATAAATGSSLGTLIATAMLTIAKQTKGRMEIEWSELGPLLEQARDAMSARGGATLGDKTVLDALDAVARAIKGLSDPATVHSAAQAAAVATLEDFRNRPNKIGRARMFAEASIGHDDPGMLAVVRVIQAIGR